MSVVARLLRAFPIAPRVLPLVAVVACTASRVGLMPEGGSDAAVDAGWTCDPAPHPEMAVSAMWNTTCATNSDRMMCWGMNNRGQLGDGTRLNRSAPVDAESTDDVVDVASGGFLTCAAMASGRVYCSGALAGFGANRELDSLSLSAIDGIDDAISVSAGMFHACALRRSGDVVCWGDGSVGQLGSPDDCGELGESCASPRPRTVSLPIRASGVACGAEQSCAWSSIGEAWCWGRISGAPSAPVRVPLPPVTQLSSNGNRYCAVVGDGQVACGSFDDLRSEYVLGFDDADEVAVGGAHVCARQRCEVLCWGASSAGQLGRDDVVPGSPPEPVPGLPPVVSIASGSAHTCARSVDGTTLCWGWGGLGQRGDALALREPNVSPVLGLSNIVSISSTAAHVCGLDMRGAVHCWGYNDTGAVGQPLSFAASVPFALMLSDVVAVSAGADHTCAALADGTVQCWGANDYWQLGTSASSASSSEPTQAIGVAGAVAVAAGSSHSCALDVEGTVRCWGRGRDGQLGYEAAPSQALAAEPVTGIGDAESVEAGFWSTFVVTRAHGLSATGYNYGGALGVAAPLSTSTPLVIADGIWKVSSGPLQVGPSGFATSSSCAVADAGVVCWGLNDRGQLGTGSTIDSTRPMPVAGIGTVRDVAVGQGHACAIHNEGFVACWGENADGQLGRTPGEPSLLPVDVVGVVDAVALAAGTGFTCALTISGEVLCWGANSFGQLGNGLDVIRSTPRPVAIPEAGPGA